jgi:hypothetical protein
MGTTTMMMMTRTTMMRIVVMVKEMVTLGNETVTHRVRPIYPYRQLLTISYLESRNIYPPHIRRHRELLPTFPPDYTGLALEAIVGIPTPGPVHSMATSMCSSYLLTGSQDGHIRAYDPWSSANGMQTMTAQQRSVVGLGESINKAGVFRGWWNNEVESGSGEDAWKGLEPVYSLACQSDALWAASGTRVSCSLLGKRKLMISLDLSTCILCGTRQVT